jgi:hypothetical protein
MEMRFFNVLRDLGTFFFLLLAMVFCHLPLIAAAAEVWLLLLLEMCSEIGRRKNWVELISSLLMFALQGCDEAHSQPPEL